MKDVKDLNKCRDILIFHAHGLEENIVKMSILLEMIYRLKGIPMKISASYFVYIGKKVLKLDGKEKVKQNSNRIVKKNSRKNDTTIIN